jgi:hypothetical protein
VSFFDTLRRVLGGSPAPQDDANDTSTAGKSRRLGALSDRESAAESGAYDRAQWHKKMKRILDELPGSQDEWPELMSEARALRLDPDWMMRSQVEEFMLLIRRAVSDRRFTEDEHRTLDLARTLIGIPEAEAEAALHSVIAEAEQFFGKPVQEGD